MPTDILDGNFFEQRFKNLFREAPFSAALLSGDDFVIEMANAISLKLWGKDNSIIGKPLLQAIPEIEHQEVYKILNSTYRSGEGYEGKEHTAYLEKDGELKKLYVNLVYKPIHDDGKITGVLAVGYDVTEQVEARKQLEQSEARTRLAIESTGLGTFEKDYQTGSIKTSPRFDEIFGFANSVPHEEYIARIHPEDIDIRDRAQEIALVTGKLRYDARIILPSGSIRWLKINGSVLLDEKKTPKLLIGTALDVTEEKQALQKIQESEERFRTLIGETPEVGAGLYLGREMRIQYVNDVMLKFWGKSRSVIGKTWHEALPELQGQPFFQQLDKVFTTGEPFSGKEVTAVLERNGNLEIGYYNYTYKGLKNANGEVYAIHHMAVDVTEQVRNKLKLIESEQSVRSLFEQAPVGIAMFKGESFVVEMVNETLLGYWGRKREEVINRSVWHALPELLDQGIKNIAENVFRTGEPYTSPETQLTLSKNGKTEEIIVRFGFRPLRDWQANIIGVLAIANDITDFVAARIKVEQNELRLKFLADSMPQVVWIAEGDGTVTYYNKRVQNFAGVRKNPDGTWVWEGILHPDDRRTTTKVWLDCVKNKTPYEIEHRVMMQDGTYRWHLSRAYAYETDEGIKWFGTATDVHDQKLLEANLEGMVRDRTLELQRSNDDLQQFAHVASHDLKEPVRKIKTFSYKLQDEYRGVLGERGNNFVNKIINATDRMFSMINGVLNYASMPASSNRFEQIDLAGIVRNVENDLEILVQEKNASIICKKLPKIKGITDLIYQLFYNLINNSLKFSKPNIPALVEVTSHEEIVIEARTYYKIIVSDNGIGFEQEYAEKIFSSFFRLNSKDKYEGSGLGLALCKKIVDRHGGYITATSSMGNGAEFHILLPK